MNTPFFDARAARAFDRFRALPSAVPEAARTAVWNALLGDTPPPPRSARLLEVGAGTGRIGRAFVAAGDCYVGVDLSLPMLHQFARRGLVPGAPSPHLVRANGRALPFRPSTFDGVLLVQVLHGAPDWARLLGEALGVLRPGGAILLGQTITPREGVDAQMRARLVAILDTLGADGRPPGARRNGAQAWLRARARSEQRVVASAWDKERSPREFLERHATGARFAALAPPVRHQALSRLADWAAEHFGGLDATQRERNEFVLEVYHF